MVIGNSGKCTPVQYDPVTSVKSEQAGVGLESQGSARPCTLWCTPVQAWSVSEHGLLHCRCFRAKLICTAVHVCCTAVQSFTAYALLVCPVKSWTARPCTPKCTPVHFYQHSSCISSSSVCFFWLRLRLSTSAYIPSIIITPYSQISPNDDPNLWMQI